MASVVSDPDESGGGKAVDLSQLTEGERTVLRLLAQGHTVKSIASALNSTPTAINERLRQARRKTGVGSSREVARMLSAQENRHEKIEVAVATRRQFHEPKASDNRSRLHRLGAAVMIVALVTTLGVATFLAERPSTRAGPTHLGTSQPAGDQVIRIYDHGTLMGSPDWWRKLGLAVGTPIYDRKGALLGTVDRMEPDNDVVRYVIVRSTDGRRVYAAAAGGLSESGTTWSVKVYELRASR